MARFTATHFTVAVAHFTATNLIVTVARFTTTFFTMTVAYFTATKLIVTATPFIMTHFAVARSKADRTTTILWN